MNHFTHVFPLAQYPGWDFRVWSRSKDWRNDVGARMAVLQRSAKGGHWVDFMTIREPEDVAQISAATGMETKQTPEQLLRELVESLRGADITFQAQSVGLQYKGAVRQNKLRAKRERVTSAIEAAIAFMAEDKS